MKGMTKDFLLQCSAMLLILPQLINYQYHLKFKVEMFYLNTIEQLFLFVEQLDQLEVCIPSRLLTGLTAQQK